MIKDLLIPALRERYPGVVSGEPPDPIAVFETPWPGVGPVEILDDEWEATVCIGDLTHGHFNAYTEGMTQAEIDETVTEMVLDFLDALFDDRILVWSTLEDGMGGWIRLDRVAAPIKLRPDTRCYVWSGPYRNQSS